MARQNASAPNCCGKWGCLASSPRPPNLTGGQGKLCLGERPAPAHQVVLLVAHLGGVPAHAVHRQQQVQEGEGRVQPQQVIPGTRETVLKANARLPLLPRPSGTSPQSLWGHEECYWQSIHRPCQQPPGAQSGSRSRDSSLTGRAETQPSRSKALQHVGIQKTHPEGHNYPSHPCPHLPGVQVSDRRPPKAVSVVFWGERQTGTFSYTEGLGHRALLGRGMAGTSPAKHPKTQAAQDNPMDTPSPKWDRTEGFSLLLPS